MKHFILTTKASADYELLDSGAGRKLERYGALTFSRPDPQAIWPTTLPESKWQADLAYIRTGKTGEWKTGASVPKSWPITFEGLTFEIRPTTFKHTGLFPEQAPNWQWSMSLIEKAVKEGREISVLNLFGYTGGATLAAAKAGAKVTHVDASKMAVEWARENATLSGLADAPIRWILDDAKKFIEREAKRGNRYDAIIMDPPTFGHGPKNEVWKIEEDFTILLELARKVLTDDPLFFLLNGYAAGYSPISYANSLEYVMRDFKGTIEMGELALEESESKRLLPAGIFARWQNAL